MCCVLLHRLLRLRDGVTVPNLRRNASLRQSTDRSNTLARVLVR